MIALLASDFKGLCDVGSTMRGTEIP